MDSSPSQNIYIPEQWSEAAESISCSSTPPIVFICGAKNCGKTTFSRYLLNILLHKYTKVAYLDTDVGQPEFTPPASLSLTIVHKVTPELDDIFCALDLCSTLCLFFGDVSCKRDPSTYLSYVFAIYDYYQKEYGISVKGENPCRIKLPLIVNTPGWVKGVGYDVLVDMLNYISPTHVVKISTSSENKNLPAGEFWVLFQKDARPLRDLRIMAYFRQCFSSDLNISTMKELAHALASHCPYEVPIASIKIRHLHCEVPSSEIFFGLNATIVGLAVDSEGPENLPWCFGLGIVRGIDTVKRVLYLITPVPHSSLEKVNLLLRGYIQIPSCLLQARYCFTCFFFLLDIIL
ncbi:Polynucleotide 5'-hydroxyl-kinase [Vigna angularis]|uniref:Polynucleotide 5'-hydroxyl-kinase n=1 Tax=Phaseolus angularis TaxID=3914 RepID=A0A8T0KQX0_PHAAN|nr:Polynucleotide 5'-hydroxyl-kinase [Vigna angularis]